MGTGRRPGAFHFQAAISLCAWRGEILREIKRLSFGEQGHDLNFIHFIHDAKIEGQRAFSLVGDVLKICRTAGAGVSFVNCSRCASPKRQ
jgi:hypothetical protein